MRSSMKHKIPETNYERIFLGYSASIPFLNEDNVQFLTSIRYRIYLSLLYVRDYK